MNRVRVYLAAPIFAKWNIDYNEKLAQKIEEQFPEVDLYVPQRNASINDKTNCATSEDIAQGDIDNNLDKDDIMIALIDGDIPGCGTSVEVGYFARICEEEKKKYGRTFKRIIALYTDTRECSTTVNSGKVARLNEIAENQFAYCNLLLVGICKREGWIVRTEDELLDKLAEALKNYE